MLHVKLNSILLLSLTLLFIVLILPFVYSIDLYTADHFTRTSFILDGDNYTIIGSSPIGNNHLNFSRIVLKRSGSENISFNILLGTCYTGVRYIYCYNSLRFNTEDSSSLDDRGYFQPYLSITVKDNIGDIVLTRPAGIELEYDTEGELTVTAQNNGLKRTYVTYIETFPDGVYPRQIENCVLSGKILTAGFLLDPGEEKSFRYAIKARDYNTRSWPASYSYSYDADHFDVDPGNFTFSIVKPFEVTYVLSKNSFSSIDESFSYKLSLINKDSSERMNFNVVMETNGDVISSSIPFNGKRYLYSGTIDSGKVLDVNLNMISKQTGNFFIKSWTNITINNRFFSTNDVQNYAVVLQDVVANFNTSSEYVNVGQDLVVSLEIENKDPEELFFNINGKIKGLENVNVTYPTLYEKEKAVLFQKRYRISDFNGKSNITLSFNGNYYTKNNQLLRFSAEKIIFVNDTIPEYYVNSSLNDLPPINYSYPDGNDYNRTNNSTIGNGQIGNGSGNLTNESSINPDTAKMDFVSRFLFKLNRFISNMFSKK